MKQNHILIAATGGIALYKVCDLVSKLTQKGYEVKVVMSKEAEKFVAPLTFEALCHGPVYTEGMDYTDLGITHIELARWADIVFVAPASANTIAKLVHGLADNLLTSTLIACTCPVLLAPAMNSDMLANPITQHNLNLARKFGFFVLESESGYLACGTTGSGRLPTTPVMISFIEEHLKLENLYTSMSTAQLFSELTSSREDSVILEAADALKKKKPLSGKTVLISAGPTIEAIDPVRFISNHSSGKQGYALAKAARNWGARVILVSGPVSLPAPDGVELVHVKSALDMLKAMQTYQSQAQFIIMAAAVADYRPAVVASSKMKKGDSSKTIELISNPDILATLSSDFKKEQIVCGFAMETENLLENAKGKLEKKHLDMIVANSLSEKGAGFKNSTNIVTFLDRFDTKITFPLLSKKAVSYQILARLLEISKLKLSV